MASADEDAATEQSTPSESALELSATPATLRRAPRLGRFIGVGLVVIADARSHR